MSAGSKGQTSSKMAKAVVTLRIMPESTETNLEEIEQKAKEEIKKFCGETETKTSIEPVAFGLNALKIIFVMDEAKGSPDPAAENIAKLEGVNSAEVIDVRRAIG